MTYSIVGPFCPICELAATSLVEVSENGWVQYQRESNGCFTATKEDGEGVLEEPESLKAHCPLFHEWPISGVSSIDELTHKKA